MIEQNYRRTVTVIVAITFFLAGYFTAHAETATVTLSVPCTNENWQYSPDCTAPVEHFEVDPITRNATGTLTSGKTFTQTWYTDSLMIFKMDNVCWLTNGHTTVYCE